MGVFSVLAVAAVVTRWRRRCVCVQGGEETQFKVKRSTPFKKVFDAFASRKGIDVKMFKFTYDGARIQPTDTPGEVRFGWQHIFPRLRDELATVGRHSLTPAVHVFCVDVVL